MSRRLPELLSGWQISPGGMETLPDICVNHLSLDSRQVGVGDAFIALAGQQSHGLTFASQAVASGAAVILADADQEYSDSAEFGVPVIWVTGLAERLAELASRFYGAPSEDLKMVGITGTNGKTSVAHFVAQCWQRQYGNAGFIGTIGKGPVNALRASGLTTPDAVSLQRTLAEFSDADLQLAAIEVSSHALDQGRCDFIRFDVAVFTNLSRDHLDYHGDLENYSAAKRRLFTDFRPDFAVINGDDAVGRDWMKALPPDIEILSFGLLNKSAEIRATSVRADLQGLEFELQCPWGRSKVRSSLLGAFNILNLLATVGVLGALGMPFAGIITQLELIAPVPGRMMRIDAEADQPAVVVDFAHTPDALFQVLQALRPHVSGRLFCVFGCGGDRDKGKRPQMGAISEQWADQTVVTNDNPRSEDSAAIIQDVLQGMKSPQHCQVQPDRAAAIRWAIASAQPQDLVLIAGKGHENYQEIGDCSLPFDDSEQARLALGVAA